MKTFFFIFLLALPSLTKAQVRIRVFSAGNPESVIFKVVSGKYSLDAYDGNPVSLEKDVTALITIYKGRIAVKIHNMPAFAADSLLLSGISGNDVFSLKPVSTPASMQNYSGNLEYLPDLGTLVMINHCTEEDYIAGVVKTEGGGGKSMEYFKAQAVLARTYLYKYLRKHSSDGFDLCDNTHCQAFNGITTDQLIISAARNTKDRVILTHDSTLIISAFHSNCGGETSASGDVWLTTIPYLRKISDPYCISSRNARWERKLTGDEWIDMLLKLTGSDDTISLSGCSFNQESRVSDYRTGTLKVPLAHIRDELGLRSTFFSVIPEGDSIILRGKGYGHGVGLCQEGAMNMAAQGFSYTDIIKFYYPGVIVADISFSKPGLIVR